MSVRNGTKVFICGDEVGEEEMFPITDETWLTAEEGEVEERREMKQVTDMGFQLRVGLGRQTAFIVSWCAVELRLQVRR